MNNFLKIEVGEKLSLIKNPERYLNFNGSIMEMHKEGIISIMAFLPKMTESEIEALKKNKIKVKVLKRDNMIITYFRLQGTPLIFELSFNPHLYADDRINNIHESDTINFLGVESTNVIVKSYRIVSIPRKLQSLWKESWQTSDYQKYSTWLSELQQLHLMDIWDRAEYIGTMGAL